MTNAPLPDVPSPADPTDGPIFGPAHLTRALIFILAAVFALVFKYTAEWLPWPREVGFAGSLAQPISLSAFIAALVLLIVCTILGTLILGKRWYLAGLMTATAGLATWSIRGGSMTQVLFNAENTGIQRGVFIHLLGELIVFIAVIGGLWTLIWNTTGGCTPSAPHIPKPVPGSDAARSKRRMLVMLFGIPGYVWATQSEKAAMTPRSDEGRSAGTAILGQIALMAIILIVLAVTPLKKQALVSVFIAALISTAVAENFLADRTASRWYWIAPLVVGAVGYLATYFNPAGIETGDPQGMFAPLARVLPLDYASLGCAGALFGYWWMEPEEDESDQGGAKENAESSSSAN